MIPKGVTCGYADGPKGQLHYRMVGEAGNAPPLICLHPAPFSGLAFTQIMPLLAEDRLVIAPDYPGHGGSHAFKTDAQISDYAEAMAALIPPLCGGASVDLFGFHTGCLVAAEMALMDAVGVGRLVLCDVPAFEPSARAQLLQANAAPPGFTSDLESLTPAWERGITRRIASQGMERSLSMFVEQLRHGEAMNAGFYAGFSYPLEERFASLGAYTTVIASKSGLLEATRRAALLIPNAKLIERLDITRAVLDETASLTASAVVDALRR